MQLINCEHPVRIADPHHRGRFVYVPCGHCDLCLNARSSRWITRLEKEASCWPYVVFFTLTYDNKNCPVMSLMDDGSFVDVTSGETLPPDVYNSLSPRERAGIRRRHGVRYASVRDVQLFMKRLRYFFSQSCKPSIDENKQKLQSEDPVLRYYIASEISPTGYRPHYHGLLFFRSSRCFAQIDTLISKSWQLGLVDCSTVQSSAANYVARYVNCYHSLPKVYQFKPFRPFSLSSRRPPLGTLAFGQEEVLKMFHCPTPFVFDTRNNQLFEFPLWTSLKNNIFPTITGFDNFSHSERVALYGVVRFSGASSYEEFKEWYSSYILDCPIRPQYFAVGSLYRNLYAYLDYSRPDYLVRLKRLYTVSNRVLLQCKLFNVSLDYYVTRIEEYRWRCEMRKLRSQYELIDDFQKRFGHVKPFIFLDEDFIETFYSYGTYAEIPWWMLDAVSSFGFDPYRFYQYREEFNIYRPEFCEDFQRYISKVKKIVRDTHKTRAKNEYLQRHPECRII